MASIAYYKMKEGSRLPLKNIVELNDDSLCATQPMITLLDHVKLNKHQLRKFLQRKNFLCSCV